jgi:hypothetical protein
MLYIFATHPIDADIPLDAMVRIPMMPKGVEHLSKPSGIPLRDGENSDDAERR